VPPATESDDLTALEALRGEVESCTLCDLHATRTRAVFGEGDPRARLMFVGEAPGYHEDQQGRPFVGAAGKLLEELLGTIGLTREQVFIANVLKSRPPNNRDPQPGEIEACQPYLWRQIALIKPRVICTLGNFATKLLSGDPVTGITRVHGRPQQCELGGHAVTLYPIFHPAAALYTPAMLTTLREDFAHLPALLGDEGDAPAAAPAEPAAPPTAAELPEPAAESPAAPPAEEPAAPPSAAQQLGLF
jgi:uracil-DNA glycosylase family 4